LHLLGLLSCTCPKEGKDVSDLVESDFKSKDDYHTWMKNRRKEKAANEMAEELQKSGGGAWKKDEIYKMATSRSGMSSGAIEKVRKRHFLRHLYTKCIILPRQARDKHRETQKKMAFRTELLCGEASHRYA
jgi:hypothetical protein